jgi:hypothetical protein
MSRPTFEFFEGDQKVKLTYTDHNGYRHMEEVDLARLSRWINTELRTAYIEGQRDKLYEFQKLLEVQR